MKKQNKNKQTFPPPKKQCPEVLAKTMNSEIGFKEINIS